MSSPAERFAAANRRHKHKSTALAGFEKLYNFPLDPFQIAACEALEQGRSVLVAAPTGAGKTIVGEFAVHLSLAAGKRCFYTTPIKALSNQKFTDLQQRYGASSVGLLTGDNAINGDAPIVVMTTEVLRNMLYAKSNAITNLTHVVMDEVHYLADRSRGAVWEEVLINLPPSVAIAALSATVSNAEEFGRWLGTVRGHTDVIVEEHRPVPLWQHVAVGTHLHDLFIDDEQRRVNPELTQRARAESQHTRGRGGGRGGSRRDHRPRRGGGPKLSRPDLVRRLERADLLPAIDFIFSRAACDAAVEQCVDAGIYLTNESERHQIRDLAMAACAAISPDDLHAVGFGTWLSALERGLAAHHAGMVPVFKEVVEKLFQLGLVKCVFATETLALGINMPARSVVLEKLVKWNGEAHVDLTPGEYTQITGRAGRRGIDVEGHAVVAWSDGFDPKAVAGLASTRTYPLRSSFRPSYNMAVNLVSATGRDRAAALLESSFAQFQADAGVVELAAEIERNSEPLAGYRESMHCDQGDFREYAQLREDLQQIEKDAARLRRAEKRSSISDSLHALRRGDVIVIPRGRRAGPVAVVDAADPMARDPRVLVVGLNKKVDRLGPADISEPVKSVARVKIPKNFNGRSANSRKLVAENLREIARDLPETTPTFVPDAATTAEIERLRSRLRAHPCHDCPDREAHARWAERYHKLARRDTKLRNRISTRTSTIARQFDKICDVLIELGYLQQTGRAAEEPAGVSQNPLAEAVADLTETNITADGKILARIYGDTDLLTAQSLRLGRWDGLTPAELASVCAALVYESRGREEGGRPRLPRGPAGAAISQLGQDWEVLHEVEVNHGLATLKELDLGLCWAIYRWANGTSLDQVLWEAELTAGDFIRWCKQIIDLLGQISQARSGTKLADTARSAAGLIDRGLVTHTGVHD
ncbi:MAG: DEAD/DEAH box helicase [Actinomycetia bacterium]|nr:DEAD/DEAH box helicase [Actinomycetes bacterium]